MNEIFHAFSQTIQTHAMTVLEFGQDSVFPYVIQLPYCLSH